MCVLQQKFDVIKQNESEIGSDMLLVSDDCISYINQYNLKPDTCNVNPYNIRVNILDLCNIDEVLATSLADFHLQK